MNHAVFCVTPMARAISWLLTPFLQLAIIQTVGVTDPMDNAILISLIHELWVSGEPAGFARHITTDPLPGTSIPGPVEWTALYFPAGSTGDDVPTRLLLSSIVIGGPSFPIEFVRPSDLDWLESH